MERVEAPESKERHDDAEVVEATVLVHALVVRDVNWVVPVAVALILRPLSLLCVCLDGR